MIRNVVTAASLAFLASAGAQVIVPDAGDNQAYSLDGTVENKRALAFVLLSRKSDTKIRIGIRIAIGDTIKTYNEVVTQAEPRFVLVNPAGFRDRLLGRRVPTTDLVIKVADGQRLELEVQEGTHPIGTVAGKRLDRPGPDPRDWRSNLFMRGPVMGYGIARAFWDLVKPGTPAGQSFRGESTAELSARVAKRLDLTKELSVAQIFRAARAETQSDREALQAAIGFLFDTPDLLYRPFPGIPESEPREDKYLHFFVSALLSHRSNQRGSLLVGWTKEVLDMRPGGSGYNDQDLFADLLGANFGHSLRFGEVRDY